MKGQSVYKEPGGKLVRVSLEEEHGKISSVKVSGDFFMHPEEGIGILEERLEGKRVDPVILEREIRGALEAASVKAFGISPAGLAKAIAMASENGKRGAGAGGACDG